MTWRTTGLLLAAVLMAGVLIFASERKRPSSRAQSDHGRFVLPFDAQEVDYLKIEWPDAQFILEKKDPLWQITHPLSAPADPSAVYRILETAAEIKWSALITADEARRGQLTETRMGFDAPRVRLTFKTSAGKTHLLAIGSPAGSARQSYVRSGLRNDTMVADHSLMDRLPRSTLELRDRKLLPFSPDAVTRIECTTPENAFQISRLRDEGWILDRPVQARASRTAVRAWLDEMYQFRIQSFVADSLAAASLYGLDKPAAQLVLSSEGRAPHIIRIGRAAGPDQRSYYASIAGQDQVFAVDAGVLNHATVGYSGFRDHRLLPFAAESVTAITLRNRGQLLQLTRSNGNWSAESPRAFEAYAPAVEALLNSFDEARVLRFLDAEDTSASGKAPEISDTAVSFKAPGNAGSIEEFAIHLTAETADNRILCTTGKDGTAIELSGGLARHFSANPIRFRSPLVFELDEQNIQRITQQASGGSITLVNRGGLFHPVNPMEVPDTDALAKIIAACSRLTARELIADDARDPTLYGFEPGGPQLIFGMAPDGINRVLLIGRTSPDGDVYAMRQGHDLLFTISRSLADLLMAPIAHLPSRHPTPSPETTQP